MKKHVQFLCSILFLLLCGLPTFVSAASEKKQKSIEDACYEPISFTPQGINHFFTHVINTSCYKQNVLPNNLQHINQFIEHGIKRRQGRAYIQSIMRLFNNTLKGSMYVNAYTYNHFLEQLTPSLVLTCAPVYKDAAEAMKKRINEILYEHFLHKFEMKQGTTAFFDGITTDITQCVQEPSFVDGDISCAEFRKTLMSFLEHTLSKLVWSSVDGIDSWQNVKMIGQSLEKLLEKKIITDEDDLNDLFISLVERYALFIDINATTLPFDMYKQIQQEVLAHNLYFLELEEQESFLEKKSERMIRALLEGEAKKRAVEYGIVTS